MLKRTVPQNRALNERRKSAHVVASVHSMVELYNPRSCFYDYPEKRPMSFSGFSDTVFTKDVARDLREWCKTRFTE